MELPEHITRELDAAKAYHDQGIQAYTEEQEVFAAYKSTDDERLRDQLAIRHARICLLAEEADAARRSCFDRIAAWKGGGGTPQKDAYDAITPACDRALQDLEHLQYARRLAVDAYDRALWGREEEGGDDAP